MGARPQALAAAVLVIIIIVCGSASASPYIRSRAGDISRTANDNFGSAPADIPRTTKWPLLPPFRPLPEIGFDHTRRCMISASGRITLIAPAVYPADHYCRLRRAKAEATVERGSPNTASPARDWCRETRHLGDRGTPSPSSHPQFSMFAAYMAGSTLSSLNRAPPSTAATATVAGWAPKARWQTHLSQSECRTGPD
jgi:hypothetical protein